jgi:hypothetical protein
VRGRTLFCEADRVRYGTVQCRRGSAGRPGAARHYSPGFPSPGAGRSVLILLARFRRLGYHRRHQLPECGRDRKCDLIRA